MKTLATALLLFASPALAAGFALDTHGARATGMGTAVTSQIDDASAVYYNPAGVAQGQHLDVQLGDTLISPSIAVVGPSTKSTSTEPELAPPPHLFASYGLSDAFSLGLGLYTPFGATIKWPAEWEGRQRTLSSAVATYAITPEASFKLGEHFRFGAGVSFVRGTVDLQQGTNFVDSEGSVELGGGAWGTGLVFGAQVSPIEHLWLGASYRTDVPLEFAGRAHFSNVPPELASKLKDQAVHTTIRLPEVATFGVSFKPLDQLTIAADMNYYRWSRFDAIDLHFDDASLDTRLAKNWTDTLNYHVGAEYAVNDAIRARLGFVFDPSPSPVDTITPDLPDATRMKLTVGAGYKYEAFNADLGYQYVILQPVTSTSPFFPGTYSGSAHVIGITLAYRN